MTGPWLPQSEQEVSRLLVEWQAENFSLFPCGNRSRLKRHFPYPEPDHWISSAQLKEIVWVDPQDRTCEVQSGISPLELENNLAAHQLSLGVSAAKHGEGTLGGLFLAPDHSLLSKRFGFSRDQVLGGRWALADGTIISSGARVVKSVAGYDLTRLLLGSRGQLAFCISLILKLRPSKKLFWFQGPVDAPAPTSPSVHYHFVIGNQIWFADEEEMTAPDFHQADEVTGQAALAQARHGFGTAPLRLHQPGFNGPPTNLPDGFHVLAHDWAANTCAIANDSDAGLSAAILQLQNQFPTAVIVPETFSPAWLAQISQALAPQACPFGQPTLVHG